MAMMLPVLGAALVWWFGRGGEKMEVRLAFVGFTNCPVRGAAALILATNSGNVTILVKDLVVLTNYIEIGVFDGDYGICSPVSGSPWPAQLRPHETVVFEVAVTNLSSTTYYVYCLVQRHQLADRLYHRASGTFLDSFFSGPPGDVAIFGPIPEPSSDNAQAKPSRVARP